MVHNYLLNVNVSHKHVIYHTMYGINLIIFFKINSLFL
jgi:hypothetical protein